jgi:precorrin-6B C5,15-methyltransferase / cobalt-precorrin-6B C5,C15-methyltransferase
MSGARLTVVGIGADGWDGLVPAARVAIRSCDEIIGSARQLELLPAGGPPTRRWPSPIGPLVDELVAREEGRVCILASGDPMLHGIGATLARRVNGGRLTVIPHQSAFSLTCARLGWPAAEVELVTTLSTPVQAVVRCLQPRRRLIVYAAGPDGAARVAATVTAAGYGDSRMIVLEQLGGAAEAMTEARAADWGERTVDSLHAVALECVRDAGAALHPRSPGLPDEAYESDGQLTKRHIRAVTLAALAPTPGALLWDVGAGSGSVAIEWLRAESTATAIAVERDEARADRIAGNALSLGVPGLRVVRGSAPAALAGLDTPDAVFIGGGLTAAGIVDHCWERLAPGGRLVANAVTLESERVLLGARETHGGTLTRIEISDAEPLGAFTSWRAHRPVTQWLVEKRQS